MTVIKILKAPIVLIRSFLKLILVHMPGGIGIKIRYFYYRRRFKECGSNLVVDVGVHIDGEHLISVGDNVFIDKNCIITTSLETIGNVVSRVNDSYTHSDGEIVVGSNVHIAQFCIIMGYGGIQIADNFVMSANSKVYSLTNTAYDLSDKSKVISIMPYDQAPFLMSPIVLMQNVWLGLNVVVMPGSVVNRDSFVSSNSVVMGKFKVNSYIEGQPAIRVRDRFMDYEIGKKYENSSGV